MVLAPWKPFSDIIELSDFDKCKICINCKITHNKQDNKLYIIKKDIWFWVSNYYLFITLQKDITNVYVRPTDWATKTFKIQMWYILLWYNNTVNMHHAPFSIVQSTVNGIIEPSYREWTVSLKLLYTKGIKKRNRQKYKFCVFKWRFGEISFEIFLFSINSMWWNT